MSQYIVFKLGGKTPYIKFSQPNELDEKFFHELHPDLIKNLILSGQSLIGGKEVKFQKKIKEQMIWLNLAEKGKFILPLRHIRFLYKDENNKIIRNELAVEHCIEYGCVSIFDTKNYYIYGPKVQMNRILSLKAPSCTTEDLSNLPDMEFAFYNFNDKTRGYSESLILLTLEPKDYMINDYERNDGNICVPGFGDTGTNYGWSFGIMFIRKFVMVYDFQRERLGFVRATEN